MKKYLRVACSVCGRSADRLVDNVRFTPDKCSITFRCEGRLFPVEYKSDAGITSVPRVGITDWRPRTTSVVANTGTAEVELIDTSTGDTKQIVLAALLASDPGNSTLTLTLQKRTNAPKAFRQYVYRSEVSFTSVSGVEAGLSKKVLRYSPTDTVEVYLNGVKLERGTLSENYEIYDGTPTSAVPPNTIRFNEEIALPGVTQVDVIVAPVVAQETSTLVFKRVVQDESRYGTGAWENIGSVDSLSTSRYYLFYLDLEDATDLQLNTILIATGSATIGISQVQLNNIFLLLARKPYTHLDRYTTIVVPLSTLSFERDYFKYVAVDSDNRLLVTSTSLEAIYPPLRPNRFITEKTLKFVVSGSTDQLVVDGNRIVGPDS